MIDEKQYLEDKKFILETLNAHTDIFRYLVEELVKAKDQIEKLNKRVDTTIE